MNRSPAETSADTSPGPEGSEQLGSLDQATFARLLSEHTPGLRVIAAAMVGGADADDVLQDASITAAQRLDRYTPGTDFRAWMAAFVRGTARNARRRSLRRANHEQRAGSLRLADNKRSEGSPNQAGLDQRTRNALLALGHHERACLILRLGHEYTYDQIGESLGIPSATARSHVHRARRRLAALLEEDRQHRAET